jgi:hypothetical protein
MERYIFQCELPGMAELARAASDLLPEGTRFRDGRDDAGPYLEIHSTAHAMGRKSLAWTVCVRFPENRLERYAQLPPFERGRAQAILHAHLEALLQSLDQRFAQREALADQFTLEMPADFA